MTPMVQAQEVCKSFGALHVLKGITLEVGRGEVLCMVGPSGSGKSTFLRCINHLEQVNAGRLYVDGDLIGYRDRGTKLHEMSPRDAAKQRRNIGMVFQHFNLFPHRTALENIIEAPIHVKGVKKDAAVARGKDLLDQVGLSEKANAYPAQLSGGQQQRVAIARALVFEPEVLLLDEPLSNLDARLRAQMGDEFRALENTERCVGVSGVNHKQHKRVPLDPGPSDLPRLLRPVRSDHWQQRRHSHCAGVCRSHVP